MKTCTKCDLAKQNNHFYKRKDGLSYMCKDCYSIWRTDHYKKYIETYKAQRAKVKGTLKFRYQKLKSRAKKKRLELTLTIEQLELIIQNPCFYCQYKLGSRVTDGIGLDRLDSSLGYIDGNCVSCCGFCNTIKNELLTYTEMQKVALLIMLERGINPEE